MSHNYCNVVKLVIHQNENTFDIKIENSKGQSDHVYFSNSDKDLIINQIESNSPYCIWFDDISYHIRFYRSGMRIMHVYERDNPETFYNFNTSVIVDWIKFISKPDDISIYLNDCLQAYWNSSFRDKIIPDIENDVKALYCSMIQRSKSGDKYASEFVKGFKSICRWALTGKVTNLLIQFDSYSEQTKDYPSLYWHVSNEKYERLINGGLIFHNNYGYSIHT